MQKPPRLGHRRTPRFLQHYISYAAAFGDAGGRGERGAEVSCPNQEAGKVNCLPPVSGVAGTQAVNGRDETHPFPLQPLRRLVPPQDVVPGQGREEGVLGIEGPLLGLPRPPGHPAGPLHGAAPPLRAGLPRTLGESRSCQGHYCTYSCCCSHTIQCLQ